MLIYYLAFIILWSTPGYTTPASTSKKHSRDKIDYSHIVVNEIINLHLSKNFSDVNLVVGNEKFHAHRIILALRSEYFRDLFYGKHKTTELDVKISAESVNFFNILLEYIYTGQMPASVFRGTDNISKFFDMVHTFGVSHLQSERPKSKKRFSNRVNHINLLISDIESLIESERFSDVVFVFGEERLHAHRFLLASQSEIFRVLLCEGHKERNEKNVAINEMPITPFKTLLRCIYTGQLDLSDLEDGDIFELLKISDFYNVMKLKHKLHKYLQKSINLDNACSFHDTTRLYELKELEVHSLIFIDMNASAVLNGDDFQNLSPGTLTVILNRDSFFADELVIFNAVCRWINNNQNKLDRDTKIEVLAAVRYQLMSDEELSKARESQLISSDIILEAIQFRNSLTSDKPQFRGQLKPDENLIYDNLSNTSRGTNLIKLRNPSIVNYIEITLWFDICEPIDHRPFSYYIEVSRNGHDWERVIDHSNYNCQSHQYLWIHPQVVRYIRFVRTKITSKVAFNIMRVRYNSEDMHEVEINNGLVVPKDKYNVASEYMYACVIRGENSVNPKSLLARYEKSDFRYERYTYHPVGSGSIVVHLTQPYILSSMRMLLWGGDNHTYRYTIEVSVDYDHWKTVVDKSNENTRSWQLLNFEPTPTLYIRIIGVFSSAENEFRSVYFEAPAREKFDPNVDQDDIPMTDTESSETDTTMTENSSENSDD